MNRRMSISGWLLLLSLVLATSGSSAFASGSSTATVSCTLKQFVETVYQGPDKGLSLRGDLHLEADATGSVTGTLEQSQGPDVKVVGQVTGRAINLVFDLGNHQLLFGVGTLQHPLAQCKSPAGGSFAGPKAPDIGTWGWGLGG